VLRTSSTLAGHRESAEAGSVRLGISTLYHVVVSDDAHSHIPQMDRSGKLNDNMHGKLNRSAGRILASCSSPGPGASRRQEAGCRIPPRPPSRTWRNRASAPMAAEAGRGRVVRIFRCRTLPNSVTARLGFMVTQLGKQGGLSISLGSELTPCLGRLGAEAQAASRRGRKRDGQRRAFMQPFNGARLGAQATTGHHY
jgi:hypothetical protein